jgi:glucokinase
MPSCIVVGGPPCAGKSTLAHAVAARRGWPVLAKDAYKELVFDRLGARDDDWSRRVGDLAWDLLFREAGHVLAAGGGCILEGNFRPAHGERLRRIADGLRVAAGAAKASAGTGVRFVEVRCRAAGDVLQRRFRERAAGRHPGHDDAAAYARIAGDLAAGELPSLELGGAVLDYDTSDGFAPDDLLAALDAVLDAGDSPRAHREA